MQKQKGFTTLSRDESYKVNGGSGRENVVDLYKLFDRIKRWLFGKR